MVNFVIYILTFKKWKKIIVQKKSAKSKGMQEWRKAGAEKYKTGLLLALLAWFCGQAPHNVSPG